MPLLCRGGLGARRCADPGRTRGDRGGVPAHVDTSQQGMVIRISCGLAQLLLLCLLLRLVRLLLIKFFDLINHPHNHYDMI